MKSLNRIVIFFCALATSFLMAQFSHYKPHSSIQMQVFKEDASLYQGQSFWMAFQVKMPQGMRIGWHQPIGDWPATAIRLTLPKPLIVSQWIWQMPKVKWHSRDDVEIYYQDQFTVLAQIQWSGPSVGLNLNSLGTYGKWFLQGQTRWAEVAESIEFQDQFDLPKMRLPNQVPLAHDPLTLAEFSHIFYSMPQKLDPAFVEWNISGQKAHVILRRPVDRSFEWAVVPSHSRVDVPKTASLGVAIAQQRSSGDDVELVFDNSFRKKWLDAGIDEVVIIDSKGLQAFVLPLKPENNPVLGWIEKVSQWWRFDAKSPKIKI